MGEQQQERQLEQLDGRSSRAAGQAGGRDGRAEEVTGRRGRRLGASTEEQSSRGGVAARHTTPSRTGRRFLSKFLEQRVMALGGATGPPGREQDLCVDRAIDLR